MKIIKSYLSFCLFLLAISSVTAQSQSPEHLKYIDKFKDIAILEMERAGVPASIKLAQGILESNAGDSYLARRANNHFGIKCGDNWNGKKVYRKDDDYDSKGKLIESCFRSYRTVEACYVAHSEFLRDPRKNYRYGFLFQLNPTDYRRWAYGLKKAGYATSATYPEKLVSIIERYQLFQYDTMTGLDLDTPGGEVIAGVIMQTNDVKYTLATPQETVAEIAQRTYTAMKKLVAYNEHVTDGDQVLGEGEKIYLQRKRSSYRGRQKYHTVAAGESMMDIANLYGLRLDKLYKRNRLSKGQEPATKAEIKLRGGKVKNSPKLRKPGAPKPKPSPIISDDNQPETQPEDTSPPPVVTQPNPGQGTTPSTPPTTRPTEPTPPKEPVVEPNDEVAEDPFSGETNSSGSQTPESLPPPVVITRPPVETPPPPVVEQPSTRPPATPSPAPTSSANSHTVVKGDTLWNISQRFGLTVDTLKRLNGLTSNTISVGQKLKVK